MYCICAQELEATHDREAELGRRLRDAEGRLKQMEGPAREAPALRETVAALTAELEVRPADLCTT